jgi:hypothetical protein
MPNTAKWKITVIDNFGAGRSIDFHLFTEEEMKEYREQIGDEPGPYDFYDGFELASVVGEFEEFLYGMADDLCGCDVTISKNEEEVAKFSIENDGTIVDCDCLSDDVIPVEDGEIAVDGPGSETIIKEYRINDETPYGAVLLQKENGEWYSEFEIPENEKLDLQTFRIIVTTNRIINNFDHDDDSEDNFVTGLIINGQKAELGYNYSSDDNRQLIWYKKNNDNLL